LTYSSQYYFHGVLCFRKGSIDSETLMQKMKVHHTIICFVLLFCSCSSFQPLTKKNKPITSEIQYKIKPGKTYKFSLRSGTDLVVRVDRVDSVRIYGNVLDKTNYAYNDTFERLVVSAKKISVKKFSVAGTTMAIVIPIALIGLAASDAAVRWYIRSIY
jgi:hypothetical protein